VVLSRDHCYAVVRADADKRQVDVHIVGREAMKRGLLAIVREKFDDLHREFRELPVDERVPVPGTRDATVSYSHLLNLEEEGVESFHPKGMRGTVSVTNLLNGIDTREQRQQRRSGEDVVMTNDQKELYSRRNELEQSTKCRLLFLSA